VIHAPSASAMDEDCIFIRFEWRVTVDSVDFQWQ
jgi:hypothetical protein